MGVRRATEVRSRAIRKAIMPALRRSCARASARVPIEYPGLEGIEVALLQGDE